MSQPNSVFTAAPPLTASSRDMEENFDAISTGENPIDKFNQSIKGDVVDAEEMNAAAKKRRVEKAINLENLPVPLIHHLMHFLPTEEVTKFSILSKAFNSSWLSFPVLDFDYHFFERYADPPTFLSFIENALQLRGPHINACLHKLRFSYKDEAPSHNYYHFDPMLDVLLDFALQNNCKELDFDISILILDPDIWEVQNYFVSVRYSSLLPAFTSNFITVLKLTGLKIPTPNAIITGPALKVLVIHTCEGLHTINVSSLSLNEVHIAYCNGLQRIELEGENLLSFKFVGVRTNNELQPCDIDLSGCMSIRFVYLDNAKISEELRIVFAVLRVEILSMFHCDMAMNTTIHIPSVKLIEMRNNYELNNLVLSTPTLERLVLRARRGQNCTMDISACVALTVLIVKGAALTNEWVNSTISGLSCLEELQISSCDMLERIEFRNHKLETFSLSKCSNLKEATVDARNLLEFSYSGNLQVYPLLILSAKCSAIIQLPERNSDFWFEEMIQFLCCFDHFKQLTISCIEPQDVIFPREFMSPNRLSPLHDVKHVVLRLRVIATDQTVTQLVESLLCLAPKPEKLTFESFLTRATSTLKFEYLKKVERERVEDGCCSGVPIKCWRHYALKIEFDGFEGNGRQNLDKFFAPYMD